MIRLTRLNHAPIYLNPDLFEHMETTPDTVISLVNKQKFMVLETAGEVVERIIAFRREIGGHPGPLFREVLLPGESPSAHGQME